MPKPPKDWLVGFRVFAPLPVLAAIARPSKVVMILMLGLVDVFCPQLVMCKNNLLNDDLKDAIHSLQVRVLEFGTSMKSVTRRIRVLSKSLSRSADTIMILSF